MISKLSVHGPDRESARKRMLRALDEYEISGCRTTIPFCEFTLKHPQFISADYDTHFVPEHFVPDEIQSSNKEEVVSLAASLLKSVQEGSNGKDKQSNNSTDKSVWWVKRKQHS